MENDILDSLVVVENRIREEIRKILLLEMERLENLILYGDGKTPDPVGILKQSKGKK